VETKQQHTWVVVKDVILFSVGLTGIVYQQITGEVQEALLLVFTVMVGLPGALAVSALRTTSSIVSSSRSSQSQEQSSDSPKSSTPA